MSQDACTNGCRPSAPLVSIVTPSFNQAQFLEKTVRSVLSQDYPNIEYIIIDGGSTDGSVEIIKKYEDRLAYWVSEPDKGQAHAINKGWQRATGTIVAYLNSDDLYMPGTVTTAVQALQSQPDECMVYSDALMIDEHGRQLRRLIGRPFDIRHVITSEGFVPQPTAFIRRHALDQVGLLDERLHMCMDYDLWIRLGLHFPARYLPGVYLAKAREHAAAKTTANFGNFALERRRILDKVYCSPNIPPEILGLRGHAYSAVSFYQAAVAAYLGQPNQILEPLVRSLVESPSYVAARPVQTCGLLGRRLIPWWTGKPSPLIIKAWRRLNRVAY